MTIAIDFGTERTKLAYSDNGRPRVMRLGVDTEYIPTLFYLGKEGDVRLYGDAAAEMLFEDPPGIIDVLKRHLGEQHVHANRHRVKPKELLVLLFGALKQRVERELPVFTGHSVESVVLTMPAGYGPWDRDFMTQAAMEAGFKQVDIVPEPVAAARFWAASTGGKADTVVILDCGGGTLDWACLQARDGDYVIVPECPPHGDIRLGGHDVDRDILDYVLTLTDDVGAENEVESRVAYYLAKTRKLKEAYCSHGILRPFRIGDTKIQLEPASLDKVIRDRFVEQAIKNFGDYVDSVRQKLNVQMPTILLVGGSSKTKGLEQAIAEQCGCPVAHWDQAEYAIVCGALPNDGMHNNAPIAVSVDVVKHGPKSVGDWLTEQKAAVSALATTFHYDVNEAMNHWLTQNLASVDIGLLQNEKVMEFLRRENDSHLACSILHRELIRANWRICDPIPSLVHLLDTLAHAKEEEREAAFTNFFNTAATFPSLQDWNTYVRESGDNLASYLTMLVKNMPLQHIDVCWELGKWRDSFVPLPAWAKSIRDAWRKNISPLKGQYKSLHQIWNDTISQQLHDIRKAVEVDKRNNDSPGIGSTLATVARTMALVTFPASYWFFKKSMEGTSQCKNELLSLSLWSKIGKTFCGACEEILENVVQSEYEPVYRQTFIPLCCMYLDAASIGKELNELKALANARKKRDIDEQALSRLNLALQAIKDTKSDSEKEQLFSTLRRDGFSISNNGITIQ